MINSNVKSDILIVLKESLKAIKRNDLPHLREQSFKTVHDSSVYQDEYSISISVVIYAIFKVLEKNQYKEYRNWENFHRGLIRELEQAIIYFEKEDLKRYSNSLKRIIASLMKLDQRVGGYIDNIIQSTKIKKASNIQRHGLSSGRAAELFGISKWDLLPYSGQTRDQEGKRGISKSPKERIIIARKIFGIK